MFPALTERYHRPFDGPSGFKGSDEDITAKVRFVRDQAEAAVKDFVASHA